MNKALNSSPLRTRRRRQGYLICLMTLALSCPLTTHAAEHLNRHERIASKLMSAVLEDAEFAISERNMRITDRLHIGKAIRERGHGDFPDYEVILFCNLSYARRVLELEPGFIDFCPFKITFRDVGDKVLIAAPLLAASSGNSHLDKLAIRINNLLMEIVDFAAEEWFVTYE